MKHQKIIFVVIVGLMTLPLSNCAQSILVSSNTFSTSFGNAHIFSQAKFDFGIYGNYLFDNISFGTQAVGDVFTVSSQSDDPNYNLTLNALYNNTFTKDTALTYAIVSAPDGIGDYNGISETQLFTGLNGAEPGLVGYQIQSISFQIDSLSIQSPGSNPNNDGNWTDMSGQVSLMIYATPTPEPTTLSLLGFAASFVVAAFFRSQSCSKAEGLFNSLVVRIEKAQSSVCR
jgi:hypothetical protein